MCTNMLQPRSVQRNSRKPPSAILVLRRKYTDFRARFVHCCCGSAVIGMPSCIFRFYTGRHSSGSSPTAGCLCSLFNKSEDIAISMATNVTAFDVHVTQWNDLTVMWYLLHTMTPVTKESVSVCIEIAMHGLCWLNLPFYKAVSYVIWRFIRNS